MALRLEKLSDTLWELRDGTTSVLEINSASNTVRFNGSVNIGTNAIAGATLTNAVAGIGQSYKIARGEVTLDGSNPTAITTGLATVVACTVTDKRATAPGVDPTILTVDYGGGVTAGTVNVYAWKITATGDGTLIASTDSDDVVSWIAVGT